MPRRRPAAPPTATLENLEPRLLLSASVWNIRGTPGNDTILLSVDPQNPTQILATLNGQTLGERPADSVRLIRIKGLAGDDTITVDLLGDAAKPARINGGAGNDLLTGGDGDDVIVGGRGDDTLSGRGGSDRLLANSGNDSVTGDAGDDVLRGGRGTDMLSAGAGHNIIHAGGGRKAHNLIYADAATDRLHLGKSDSLLSGAASTTLTPSPSDSQLTQWYIDAAVNSWGDLLGQDAGTWWWWYNLPDGGGDVLGPWAGSDLPGDTGSGTGVGNSTGTNVQTPGVDEADLLKTDGQTVYLVHGDTGNQVMIVDASNPDSPRTLADLTLSGTASQLYLDHGKLIVISSVGSSWGPILWNNQEASFNAALYDSLNLQPYWNDHPQTQIAVYDVSDPANPALVETQTIDGGVIDSRLVDGRVYAAIDNSLNFPRPRVVTNADGSHTFETESEYRARLEAADPASLMPGFTVDTDGDGAADFTGSLLLGQRDELPDGAPASSGMLSVLMIDPADGHAGPDAVTSLVGVQYGNVYASTDNLYIASQDWSQWSGPNSAISTDLYKFSLSPTGADLVATGNVPGAVLDQFSMDEYNGDLRIATTAWAGATGSTVSVLQQAGTTLTLTGQLRGLAPGEHISAVRFVGDTGYISTFLSTDPLFVVNLADPTNPVVTGSLTIPGESSYLQPLDATHLIGLGRAPGGNPALLDTLQLSLFDVSDPAHPQRLDTLDLPTGDWTYSVAEWNHHAFSYFPDQDIFALPLTTFDTNGYQSTAQVIQVQIDPAAGFTLIGAVTADSDALRTTAIGQSLYVLTGTQLIVADLTNPANVRATIAL